ncbi:MAG: S9 family peptidase [Gemmatimonadales bacterium]
MKGSLTSTAAVIALLTAGRLLAQTTASVPVSALDQAIRAEGFVAPAGPIAEAVLAPRHRLVTLTEINADRSKFLREVGDGPVTMAVFSRPFHELGGLFVDFRANRSRNFSIRSNLGLEIISATDGSRRAVEVPAGVRITDATWSPDGRSVAFFGHTLDATHLWIADAASGRARQITRTPVLATLATGFEWSDDSKHLVTVLIPEARLTMPERPAVPPGPQVKLAEEKDKNRLRNFASLLATPYDQALLEWHVTGQAALIDVESRAVTRVGQATMIQRADLSPDGKYLRVVRMVKPFSYIVPVGNFGTVEEIWDLGGRVLAKVGDEPLNLGADTARVATAPGVGGGETAARGRREVVWRQDGQGLSYLEQAAVQPGDSAADDAEGPSRPRRKDRVYQWLPPFDSASQKLLYENNGRLSNVRYSADHRTLFASERAGPTQHEFAVVLAEPTKKLTLARYRSEDFGANPGALLLADGTVPPPNPFGGGFGGFGARSTAGRVVATSADGNSVYYYGIEYGKDPLAVGPKTYIERVPIRGGTKERIYQSDNAGSYERVAAVRDLATMSLIVSRESATEVPQTYRRDGGALVQLTQNVDPTPDLTRAPKETFIVERPDGFKFKVNVTLPPGYQPGVRLPAMFWFYPREYAGQDEYDRGARTFNKNAFPSFNARSIQFLARAGYAVVEPDAPIVGATGQMNNNYEHDLRNNLAAVIDEVDRRGIVDRTRIGIGGHSYGAFSTVNAMVHTPFFKAGIAGDGNYNRTLTPLAFQSERRDLWEAKDTYLSMSPLLHANNLTGALLLYHGLSDQNVGTDPINSPRLFQALNGLGKTTSMYLYPFEDHGPATKETLLDLWARWTAWLDKYVKNAKTETKERPVSE